MKKLFAILLACAMLLPMSVALADGNVMFVVDCEEWVSLRAEPSTTAARLAMVPLGEPVFDCTESINGFTYCWYNGYSGYILTEYLLEGDFYEGPDITPECMIIVNCEEWVSLREEPSIAAARIVKVPLGAMVYNCEPDVNGFVYCEYDGMYGFILEEYLAHPGMVFEENICY